MAKKKSSKNDAGLRVLKYFVVALLTVFITAVTAIKVAAAIKHSRLFQVKKIRKDRALEYLNSYVLDNLFGKSIFDVDLKKVQRILKNEYPQIDHLKVFRRFPDEIYITAKSREPFAMVIGASHEIMIDEEGVALAFGPSEKPAVPSIQGVSVNGKISLGGEMRNRELKIALDILQEMKENEHLGKLDISQVDVSYLSKINLKLANGLKVILDRENLDEKVKKLGILVSQGNIDFSKFNYVDLRFKEPVLGHE